MEVLRRRYDRDHRDPFIPVTVPPMVGIRRLRQFKDPKQVHPAAAPAVTGAGRPLPFLDEIQRAFGRHDISDVAAHTGAAAGDRAAALGAVAFTSGNHIAFGRTPDLRTAAHEAAHVVQQRAGISLSGGIGTSGDRYERHADTVANAVTQGRSAEALLTAYGSTADGEVHRMPVVQLLTETDKKSLAQYMKEQRLERSPRLMDLEAVDTKVDEISAAFDKGSKRDLGEARDAAIRWMEIWDQLDTYIVEQRNKHEKRALDNDELRAKLREFTKAPYDSLALSKNAADAWVQALEAAPKKEKKAVAAARSDPPKQEKAGTSRKTYQKIFDNSIGATNSNTSQVSLGDPRQTATISAPKYSAIASKKASSMPKSDSQIQPPVRMSARYLKVYNMFWTPPIQDEQSGYHQQDMTLAELRQFVDMVREEYNSEPFIGEGSEMYAGTWQLKVILLGKDLKTGKAFTFHISAPKPILDQLANSKGVEIRPR